jgi:hypothetical protein
VYRFILSITIFLSIFIYYNSSQAAAWTQGRGTGQIITSFSGYSSSRYFDREGDSHKSNVIFTKTDVNPLIEYGLTDDLTVGVNINMQNWLFHKKDYAAPVYDFRQCGVVSNLKASDISVNQVQAEVLLRKKLWDNGRTVFSVQPSIQSPCMFIENGDLNIADNAPDAELRLLSGYAFKWEPKGVIRRPFAGQYHFLNAELAYRKRDEKFADQIKIDGTAGFRANDKLLLLGQVFSTFSAEPENIRGVIANNILYTEKDDFYSVKAQLSAIRQFNKNASIQLGVYNEVLGKNSGHGSGILLAWWRSF